MLDPDEDPRGCFVVVMAALMFATSHRVDVLFAVKAAQAFEEAEAFVNEAEKRFGPLKPSV